MVKQVSWFPPEDVDALAAKLCVLLADKYCTRKLGENGRKRVQQHFSLQAMVNNYQELYEKRVQR